MSFATRSMLGLVAVKGSFAVSDGTIHIGEPHTTSTTVLTISAASFATGNEKRDHHIASADFLDAEHHPLISFRSSQVATDALGTGPVEGYLSVRGTEAPVTVNVESVTIADGQLVAHATAKVDRLALGVTKAKGMVSRYLSLEFRIVANAG